MLDMIPNSRLRSCTDARNDETAITKPRTRPMIEIRPRVESVTWPEKALAYFCAKLRAPLPVVVS
jgi:hypothetical protein